MLQLWLWKDILWPAVKEAKSYITASEYELYINAFPFERLHPSVREIFRSIYHEYAAVTEGLVSIPKEKIYTSLIPGTDSYGQEVWHMARNNVMRALSLRGESPFKLPERWKSENVPLHPPPTNEELADLLFETTGELYTAVLHAMQESGEDTRNKRVTWFTGPNETGQVPMLSVLLQAAVHAGRHGGISLIETMAVGKPRPQQDQKNWG